MSFANRMKAKLGGHDVAPIPIIVSEPVAPTVPVPIAKNENNFIPTKYGEELAHAVKTFLPRAVGTKAAATAAKVEITPDVNSEELFPSLGGAAAVAPKTKTSMNRPGQSWADMARKKEIEEDDAY